MCYLVDVAISVDRIVKIKESAKTDKQLYRATKTVEHEGDSDSNCSWYL